jgi:multidrug resistance efflux pump
MNKIIQKIKNPKVLRIVIGIIVVIIVVGITLYIESTKDRIKIDNSLIQAPVITVSPVSAGILRELDAREGHEVKKGDVLAVVGSETIRAQNDGLIVASNNLVGGSITQATPLIQMIQTQDLRVVGTLDENKGLDKLAVGQVVSFTVDALPGKTYWGYIDEIAPTAKQTQAAFSISSERPTQQFQVYARFNTAQFPQIKNGMSAKMKVFTK